MQLNIKPLLFLLLLTTNFIFAQTHTLHLAITQPIPIDQIAGYDHYPVVVKQLINQAAALTQQNLTYLYGSADPKNKGMDCSGTIYYLLNNANIANVPRDSSEIYQWVWKNGKFHAVNSITLDSAEFSALKPGDLLFWTGTYKTNHNPPISHVMLYLGKNKEGKALMFGASDGRTYQGKQMWGVSVFDFNLPSPSSAARFIGYSCIPNATC